MNSRACITEHSPKSNQKPLTATSQLRIIPDSEEEQNYSIIDLPSRGDVIEISSGEEDKILLRDDLRLSKLKLSRFVKKTRRTKKILSCSDEESNRREVIELSDSSPERSILHETNGNDQPPSRGVENDSKIALLFDQPDDCQKPARQRTRSFTSPSKSHHADSVENQETSPDHRPEYADALHIHSAVNEAHKIPKIQKAIKRPRTKKITAANEKKKRLEAYAVALFEELNETVFGLGLPKDTKLHWNKRLLTTAGRAKWNRSKDGMETSEIELAEKIVDSEERIRNTLSHEMCHLATWIIDGNIREGHGGLWKQWASEVMRAHPKIKISTRHRYEISHPFRWSCEQCGKIYGRFSRSIISEQVVCGGCGGKLVALFSQKKAKKSKASPMLSVDPQDSPLRHKDLPGLVFQTDSRKTQSPTRVETTLGSHSDPEIEFLATNMDTLTLTPSS